MSRKAIFLFPPCCFVSVACVQTSLLPQGDVCTQATFQECWFPSVSFTSNSSFSFKIVWPASVHQPLFEAEMLPQRSFLVGYSRLLVCQIHFNNWWVTRLILKINLSISRTETRNVRFFHLCLFYVAFSILCVSIYAAMKMLERKLLDVLITVPWVLTDSAFH